MTLSDLGALGSFLASIAVFITLIYLARQVRQGNMFARYQAREAMREHDLKSLEIQIDHPEITSVFLKEKPTQEELLKLHLFLVTILREREWEWNQYRDGIIDEAVYRTYHEVIALFLCTPRTRLWWETVGRTGINPEFATEVDSLLAGREPTEYWSQVTKFITQAQDTD